ncbi:MAG: choice-of-anchor R domain-containing protein [bacterium]
MKDNNLQQKNNTNVSVRIKIMQKNNKQKGGVLTLAVIVFTMASLVLSLGIITPIVEHIKNIRGATYSKQAFYTAESLQEDILYRLKNNILVSSTENLTLGDSHADSVISGSSDRTIVVEADDLGYKRKITATVVQGDGASFSYGVQAGLGGFLMGNNAKVVGNVYANGNIVGDAGGGIITGTAIAATIPNPIANQLNSGDMNPPNSIDFGGNATPRDIAQGFKISTTTPVTSVRLYVKKSSVNPINNALVQIVSDSNGSPGKSVLGSAIMNASSVGTSYDYLELPFSSLVSLTPNTQYWLVIYSLVGSTYNERYTIGATSNTYVEGEAKVGTWSSADGGAWSNTNPSGLDIYFGLYVSGNIGKIDNISVGTAGVGGDAWANTVKGSHIEGVAYCKVGENNNKNCNTSRLDPVAQAYPISNGNISDWKADAVLGGTISSKTIDEETTLGPIKINGNLTVNSTLNISGTIWVTGNFYVDNSTKVQLSSGYKENSGMIIVDGKTMLKNGATFVGSGLAKSSYILLLSTSDCDGNCGGDYAVYVYNNAGAIIINAQNGTIYFKNKAGAKSATANKIQMEENAEITYDSGLIDINFSSGPSGGWIIDSWREFTL